MTRKITEAVKSTKTRYRKDKTKPFSMTFFPGDMKLYDHLQAQPNKSAYIKGLIADDIDRDSRGENFGSDNG